MNDRVALGLFSGGLDSILACRVIAEQGIRVVALKFVTPFFDHDLLHRRLEYQQEMQQKYGLEVELIARSGRPDYVILNVQDELDCDLIVIGSRGLSVLENVIMGSVVTRVLEGASCPVLVTRNLRVKYLEGACGL